MTELFQSTLPRKKRRKCHGSAAAIIIISIHASAKEATHTPAQSIQQLEHFNPRFRERSDKRHPLYHRGCLYFNPRFRERSDRPRGYVTFSTSYFNPRFRERSDDAALIFFRACEISIHASAKEATLSPTRCLFLTVRFQSTLPRKKRQLYRRTIGQYNIFQSTLPRKKRRDFCQDFPARENFNPRFRERSDFIGWMELCPSSYFNPRFRERSDGDRFQIFS